MCTHKCIKFSLKGEFLSIHFTLFTESGEYSLLKIPDLCLILFCGLCNWLITSEITVRSYIKEPISDFTVWYICQKENLLASRKVYSWKYYVFKKQTNTSNETLGPGSKIWSILCIVFMGVGQRLSILIVLFREITNDFSECWQRRKTHRGPLHSTLAQQQ